MVLCCWDIRGGINITRTHDSVVLHVAYVMKLIKFLVIHAFWDVMPC